MRWHQPRIQRLLRALLACWMLLVVFEPPLAASAGGQLRTLSAWLSPVGARPGPAPSMQVSRVGLGSASSAAASSAERVGAQNAVVAQGTVVAQRAATLSRASTAPLVDDAALPRGNGRYLYLELQSLLC